MDREELLHRASFGRQVAEFWGSAVGTYLRDRANECYTAAILDLKTVDPTDTKKIVAAQGAVWRSESILDWMSEAILDGLKAAELFEEGDD